MPLIDLSHTVTDGMITYPGLPGPEIVAAAVEAALRRPRRRVIVPGKYRAAVFAANAFPALADRIYAGKAAGQGSVKGQL